VKRSHVKDPQLGENIVMVSPDEIKHFLKLVGYKGEQLSRFPNFKGKKIRVTGDLNLEDTPIENMGNIEYVDGSVSLRGSKIKSLGNLKAKSWVTYSNTPLEEFERKQELQRRKSYMQGLREEGEWEIGNTMEGDMAHALLKVIGSTYDIKGEGDDERLLYLKNYLETLEKEMDNKIESGENYTDLSSEIEATQDEIYDLEQKLDVYDLYLSKKFSRANIAEFEINEYSAMKKNIEYLVGTEEDMETYAKERIEENLGDYDNEFFENWVDGEKVAEQFKDYYEDDVRNSPEVYFDDSDYTISEEDEKMIESITEKIEQLETQQSDLNNQIEDPDEYSTKYDEIQNQIDSLESQKEELESKKELTEDMIEDKVNDMVSDVERNPLRYLREFGYSPRDYVDFSDVADDIFRNDGFSSISHYDGNWENVKIGDQWFIIIRIN
jgi:predicted Holliday junction resolvase-like endonuclease